jgi:phenylalanyl-tRNA synthetase alpha chain
MNATDPLSDALVELDALRSAGLSAFETAITPDAVEAARVEFLGQKHGRVKAAQERLKSLEPAARKGYGQRFNAVKTELRSRRPGRASNASRRAANGWM